MNAGLERVALSAGLLVLVASLQFGFGVAGPALALPGALILGVLATLLWQRFELPSTKIWLAPLLITGAVFLSTLLLEVAFRSDFASWFACLAAPAGSGGMMYIALRNRARCGLCERRLASQAVTFCCPRCSQVVCEETCWSFEHRRCELCLEQRVPVLPIENAWWSRVAGPRGLQGRCQVCLASAEQTDLRFCPRCRRPQCRDCWDFHNGECGRCAAPLPGLPSALETVVGSIPH